MVTEVDPLVFHLLPSGPLALPNPLDRIIGAFVPERDESVLEDSDQESEDEFEDWGNDYVWPDPFGFFGTEVDGDAAFFRSERVVNQEEIVEPRVVVPIHECVTAEEINFKCAAGRCHGRSSTRIVHL